MSVASAQREVKASPVRRLLRLIGPGFITGASDDDPSGIGTYAVAGASLGYSILWTALVTFPLMAAVQPGALWAHAPGSAWSAAWGWRGCCGSTTRAGCSFRRSWAW